jgi:hypothetical protein
MDHAFSLMQPEGLLVFADWLAKSMEAHADAFHLAKKPRKLYFAPALGVVDLELEIDGVVQPFTVSPTLAVILLQFQDEERLAATELSSRTNVAVPMLLKRYAVESYLCFY